MAGWLAAAELHRAGRRLPTPVAWLGPLAHPPLARRRCSHPTHPSTHPTHCRALLFLAAGMRCVELGAGVGLVGLALAAMGARVTITDVAKVLPLMQQNLAANGYDPARG